MSKKIFLSVALLVIFSLALGALPDVSTAQSPVTITWFVGLGTGGQPEQIEKQNEIVAAFNASQSDIVLEIILADNNVAPDTLATLIASGNAPDIVGPVGNTGSNRFEGSFLDLEPLVEASGYDLSQFPEAAVDFYRTDDGLIGLPFATFPSFLWYRPELFDEAGLEYPPQEFGAPYILDGEEVEWNMDTLREIGMILTVDANGNDATMEGFDDNNIIQWGYTIQWSDPRGVPSIFGAAHVYDGEGNAVMPDIWREAWNWIYDAIWVDNFMPNDAETGSDRLASGNPFASGNVAMTSTHLWYTCCIEGEDFDIAVLPSHNGVYTAKLHGDTFRILNTTENPEEAFTVLSYLIGDASLDLLSVYGGMPAREEDRETFFAGLDEKYPQGVNWEVARESLNYPDIPSHESWMPNFNKAEDRLQTFITLYQGTPGLDMDAELDRLVADLQAIFDEVAE